MVLHKLFSRRTGAVAASLCALAAAGILGAAPARAAEQYLTLGFPVFTPYRTAIATLDVKAGKVEGTIAPPAGDPRPAIPVSGSIKDGVLRLTIGSGDKTADVAFVEDERGLHQVWWETGSVPGIDEVLLFRPAAGFSQTALVLQHGAGETCGQLYGGLSLSLKVSALKASPTAPAGIADLEVPLAVHGGGSTATRLKDVWSRLRLASLGADDDVVTFDVAVPLGSEATVAQTARQVPGVAAVTLPNECGETALATVPRASVSEGGTVSEARLKSFLDGLLARLYSGVPPEGRTPGARKFKITNAAVAPDAAGLPAFSATVTAESEASRLAKGSWDQFTLTVRPVVTASDAGDTISLIPAISALKTARKAAGAQIPADSAFAPQEDPGLKAALAQHLVSWIAASEGSRCAFLTRTAFEEPENGLSCGNVILDDPLGAQEN